MNLTYTHKVKGGEYKILSLAIYKTNNVDSLVVVYANLQSASACDLPRYDLPRSTHFYRPAPTF